MVNPVARQVISVSPTGETSGLQRKQGQGLDLKTLGRARIERASEIVWHEMQQRWFVRLLCDPYADCVLREPLWTTVTNQAVPTELGRDAGGGSSPLLFEHYEDAVAAEIQFLDAARLQGLLTSPYAS